MSDLSLSNLLNASGDAIKAEEDAYNAAQRKNDAMHTLVTTLCKMELRKVSKTQADTRLIEGDMAKVRLNQTVPPNLSPSTQAEWLLKEALGEQEEQGTQFDTVAIVLSSVQFKAVQEALQTVQANNPKSVVMLARYSTNHRSNGSQFAEIIKNMAIINSTRNVGQILMLQQPYKAYFDKASKEAEISVSRD